MPYYFADRQLALQCFVDFVTEGLGQDGQAVRTARARRVAMGITRRIAAQPLSFSTAARSACGAIRILSTRAPSRSITSKR